MYDMVGPMLGLIGHYEDPLVSLSLSLSLSYVYHGRTNAGTNRPL